MAGRGKSRWADTSEDRELEAELRQKKEKKRQKRARKLQTEAEARARARVESEADQTPPLADSAQNENDNGRPAKRRKVTSEAQASGDAQTARLLRFEYAGAPLGKTRGVENYEKLNDIEEGTYGWVARGVERSTGRIVALKRLKTEPSDRNGLPVTGLREIQILQDCNHDNIVRLEEVVVGNGAARLDNSIFLVLEFVEHDVKGILEDMPEPFLASEIKRLLLQLTSGVSYLHDNWILHRDLKTSNLLLNNRGQLKIADFGMARYVGDPAPPKLTQLVVTLWYRAPELLLGTTTYGAAVDMWSVGCIFAELVSREPLLQGRNEADQMSKMVELCGVPTEQSWPGFRKLPNARGLKLPKPAQAPTTSLLRARLPSMTAAATSLLGSLLSLDPARRPSASAVLQHEYFRQDPKPKPEAMFPTFPSKAGQERRRRHEPDAPVRGQAVSLGDVDLSSIFQGREREERGAGFTLRMM